MHSKNKKPIKKNLVLKWTKFLLEIKRFFSTMVSSEGKDNFNGLNFSMEIRISEKLRTN